MTLSIKYRDDAQRERVVAIATLVLLLTACIFSFLDRVLLGLLIKPIRADLGIDDTQFSLLFGVLFAGPYAITTLFAGYLADRWRRLSILRYAILLWSVSTAATMFATEFSHLALTRICVAMGEAALMPCAYSLLGDRFTGTRLGRAASLMLMGSSLGSGIALVLGGPLYDAIAVNPLYTFPVVGDVRPWQLIFLIFGFPGCILAMLIGALPEPPRTAVRDKGPQTLAATFKGLREKWQVCVVIVFAFSFCAMPQIAMQIFGTQHFVRFHGTSLAEAGLRVGIPLAVMGPPGIFTGGWLNDRWRSRGVLNAPFRVGALATLGMIPSVTLAMFSDSMNFAQIGLIGFGICAHFPFGAAVSAISYTMDSRNRGVLSALYTLVGTLVGSGLSPLFVALITKAVFNDENLSGYGVAILAICSSGLAFTLFIWGMGHLRRTMLAADHVR